MNRRTLIKTAAWSVPAVTLSAASPAFATSNDHECHPERCRPKVTRRKCTREERKRWGKSHAYEIERTCPWSHVSTGTTYGGRADSVMVMWSPNPRRGQARTYRSDAVRVKGGKR